MGLMIAFTFSGAAARYEMRRQLTVEEANAIGTAYLRLDLLPVASQPALREKFRRYVKRESPYIVCCPMSKHRTYRQRLP